VSATPVRHHEPVEAPLVAQDVEQQAGVLGAELAEEPVVGRHHAPGARLGDGRLEGTQVDLPQDRLGHADVHRHALDLGVVAHEVLHGDRDAVGLDASHEADGEAGAQLWILRVALEDAAPDGGADDVHGRSEQDVRAPAVGLLAQQVADPLDEVGVPRRAQGDADRHDDARHAQRAGVLPPHAVGAVGHLHRRHAPLLDCVGAPARGAAEQPAALVEGQVVQLHGVRTYVDQLIDRIAAHPERSHR
jgi:hypothetical protein